MKHLFLKILVVLCTMLSVCQNAFANYVNYEKHKPSDLNSLLDLTYEYQYDFKDKKGCKEAEDAFWDIKKFYEEFIDTQNKNINLNNVFEHVDDEFYKCQYNFYFIGLVMTFDNGKFYFTGSYKFIYDNFAPYLTKDWQELLEFEQYGDKILFFDYRYLNSKDELRQILKFYENFYKKYPNFSQKDMIKAKIKRFREDLKNYPNI